MNTPAAGSFLPPVRALLLLVPLLAGSALADIGPRPPKCRVPETCVTCLAPAAHPDEACIAAALDAGLVRSECSDRQGSVFSNYYCPPGVKASRLGCGCATADVLLLAGLLPLLRRRRR